MRQFAVLALWAISALWPGVSDAQQTPSGRPDHPDVLLIFAEDLCTCLGCYGNPICKTPHLDALAAQGVRFDNAECMFPLCNPTRSATLTGLYPRTTRVLGNELDWNERIKPGTTLPEYFRAHSYYTARCGKIFHDGNQGRKFDDTSRWAEVIPEGAGITPTAKKAMPPTFLYDQLTPEQRDKTYFTRAWSWGPTGLDDLEMSDGKIAEQAVRFFRRADRLSQPVLLALGFHKSHLPLLAPDRYFAMYPPENIPLPQISESGIENILKYGLENHRAFTDQKRRQAIAAYYACTSYLDACVGRVLDALCQSGRDKNTIVVLLGDHGFHLGEHRIWDKMTLFEESCRIPLLICAPGITEAGGVCQRPVEEFDIFPTLAELCGIGTPEGLQAVSIVPLLKNPQATWHRGAITSLGRGLSIRTERWRYTQWEQPKMAELYYHQSDPREMTNLAEDPKYKGVVAELSGALNER